MSRCLITLILLVIVHTCQTTYDLGLASPSCFFYVTYATSSCTGMTLDHCTWQVCTAWVYDTTGTRYCLSYQQQTSTNWKTCTLQCCFSDTYPQSSAGLTQCQDRLKATGTVVIIILCVTFGFIFIVLIILGVCYCCREDGDCRKQCNKCMSCFGNCLNRMKRYKRREYDRNNQRDETAKAEINIDLHDYSHQNWQYKGKSDSIVNRTCRICLGQRPSVVLACNHFFHQGCLKECVQRKQQCPDCHSSNLNKIQVYCEQCYDYCFQTSLGEMNYKKKICSDCLKCSRA